MGFFSRNALIFRFAAKYKNLFCWFLLYFRKLWFLLPVIESNFCLGFWYAGALRWTNVLLPQFDSIPFLTCLFYYLNSQSISRWRWSFILICIFKKKLKKTVNNIFWYNINVCKYYSIRKRKCGKVLKTSQFFTALYKDFQIFLTPIFCLNLALWGR